MAVARTELQIYSNGDLPKDYLTHVVYHTINAGAIVAPGPDWDNHCQQVLDCFSGHAAGYTDFSHYSWFEINATTYNMSDDLPRPIQASKHYTPAAPTGNPDSPAELSACLSYYAGRNIVGARGRLYVAKFSHSDCAHAFPPHPKAQEILKLGHALFDVGGENVAHVIYHQGIRTNPGVLPATYGPTKSGHAPGSTSVVSDYYVSESWTVQRRRRPAPQSRTTLHP